MDRRSFLAGLLGLAGAVAVAKVLGPEEAEAAVINPGINPDGVLDELDASEPVVEDVQFGQERRDRRRRELRRKRRYDRRIRRGSRSYYGRRGRSRRVCRTVRRNGRWRRVCRRVRW